LRKNYECSFYEVLYIRSLFSVRGCKQLTYFSLFSFHRRWFGRSRCWPGNYSSQLTVCPALLQTTTTDLQGEPKNVHTRKLRYLRNARIFLYQMLLICLQDNCAQVCCFVLYLLDMRQIDGNANFKKEFCNCTDCTKGWFYYYSKRVTNTTFVVMSLWRRHNYLVHFEKNDIFSIF